MRERYGEARAEEILSVNIHHTILYPCASIQSTFQQLRVIRTLAPDRTLIEIWHFRLKGAPPGMYRRALTYSNIVNSPSSLINADDIETFSRCHQGLLSQGSDWVSFHRDLGRDLDEDGVVRSVIGSSEAPMRNQWRAWLGYMTGEAGS